MPEEIKTISLSAFISSVNCYLVSIDHESFFLIDTGMPNNRSQLERELAASGCQQGDLKLILLTHGDIDHVGNAAYLRQKYAAKIGMHPLETPAVNGGSMLQTRQSRTLIGRVMFASYKLGQANRFDPDIEFIGGEDLSPFGFAASVVHIPGHTRGSIAILTSEGSLFCGDLMSNRSGPRLNSLIDDSTAAQTSLENLKRLPVRMVYPGHGEPFSLDML